MELPDTYKPNSLDMLDKTVSARLVELRSRALSMPTVDPTITAPSTTVSTPRIVHRHGRTLSPLAILITDHLNQAHHLSKHPRTKPNPTQCITLLLFCIDRIPTLSDSIQTRTHLAHRVMSILSRVSRTDTDALFILAHMTDTGFPSTHITATPTQAFTLYLTSTKRGHLESMYRITMMYRYGHGVPINHGKSYVYARLGAMKQHPGSMYVYAKYLLTGIPGSSSSGGLGLPKYRDGAMWLRVAAQYATQAYPHAIHDYGVMCVNGYPTANVYRDVKYGVTLLTRASEYGVIESMYSVGMVYETEGIGKRDLVKSVGWYERASVMGHGASMYRLSRIYLPNEHQLPFDLDTRDDVPDTGDITVKDDDTIQKCATKSFKYMTQSSVTGYTPSYIGLAYMYYHGIGTPCDKRVSREWYTKAMEIGYNDAVDMVKKIDDELCDGDHAVNVTGNCDRKMSVPSRRSSLPPSTLSLIPSFDTMNTKNRRHSNRFTLLMKRVSMSYMMPSPLPSTTVTVSDTSTVSTVSGDNVTGDGVADTVTGVGKYGTPRTSMGEVNDRDADAAVVVGVTRMGRTDSGVEMVDPDDDIVSDVETPVSVTMAMGDRDLDIKLCSDNQHDMVPTKQKRWSKSVGDDETNNRGSCIMM